MKTRAELYGPDILSAKRLPWALRDFIVDQGGVEKVRAEIWSQYFNPEYLRQITKGTYGPEAVAKAHQHCDTMVWETAFQKGYVEKPGRRRHAKKKTSCKKVSATDNKHVDSGLKTSSKDGSGKKSSLAKPFGDGINASVDLVVSDIWSDNRSRAISLLIAVARVFVYYRRIALKLSAARVIALEFPRRLAIDCPSPSTTLDVSIGSATFSDRLVLAHVRTLGFARALANDHMLYTKAFTVISSCKSAIDFLGLARSRGLLAIEFQAPANAQAISFQRQLHMEYPAVANQRSPGFPRQLDNKYPAAVAACTARYPHPLTKNYSKSVPGTSASCTGFPSAPVLRFQEEPVSSTTLTLPTRAIVSGPFRVGNRDLHKKSGTMDIALFSCDVDSSSATAIRRAQLKLPIMLTLLRLEDQIKNARHQLSIESTENEIAPPSKKINDDPCSNVAQSVTEKIPATETGERLTVSDVERRVNSREIRNKSENKQEDIDIIDSGCNEKAAAKCEINDGTAATSSHVEAKDQIKPRKKKSLGKRIGRLFKACICGGKGKTDCRQ